MGPRVEIVVFSGPFDKGFARVLCVVTRARCLEFLGFLFIGFRGSGFGIFFYSIETG